MKWLGQIGRGGEDGEETKLDKNTLLGWVGYVVDR